MNELFSSPLFGIVLSILAFGIGLKLQEKTKSVLCNPLTIATIIVVVFLLTFDISYESFYTGGSIINMFLPPATACLAVSIYNNIKLLKKNALPIILGCTAGSSTSMGCVYLLCRLFRLDEAMTASLIPKSITTPIAVEVCNSLGGISSITVVAVIFTGIVGNILAPFLIRFLRIDDPVAAGIAIGTSSHALGTSKAIQIGEQEGAMSGLAIGICGIITVTITTLLL